MQRVPELLDDPHLAARGFFRIMEHPFVPTPMPTENAPAVFRSVADPALVPAPLQGEHSRELLAAILGLDDAALDALVDDGVVEVSPHRRPLVPAETPGASG
jgi:crotonobetainyl-CoA:carnitine CoA-transferase CaiB-like acyl-CoA transferase